jgi:hypothetical protein
MRMGSRGHQARTACAAPLPALLPTPEGLGQRHAHGVNGVYTILGFFFFSFFLFFLFIFYFYGDPKMGYNNDNVTDGMKTRRYISSENLFFLSRTFRL